MKKKRFIVKKIENSYAVVDKKLNVVVATFAMITHAKNYSDYLNQQ
jgi:hypothetical protein